MKLYMEGSSTLLFIQFSSVPQLSPTLCNPKDSIKTGFPVHHQLPELTQMDVHWVGDTIQPSCLLSPSPPPAFNLSQHQDLSQSVLRIRWPKDSALVSVLPMNSQDSFPLGLMGWISLQPNGLSRVFSNTTVQKHHLFSTQLSL